MAISFNEEIYNLESLPDICIDCNKVSDEEKLSCICGELLDFIGNLG